MASLDKIYEFLNKEGNKYNFSPVVYDLEKQFTDLLLKDCYSHHNHEVYKKLRSIKFKSNIYFVKYDKEITLNKSDNIHIECGLL